jgi:TorA maturation chaperone TorD
MTMDGHSPDDNSGDLLAQFRAAAAADLLTLASLHHIEADDALLIDLNVQAFPDALGIKPTQPRSMEAISFMRQALGALTAPLRTEQRDELAADYAAIYLNHDYSASPYESVWLDEENLVMQAPMFQVREFYKRHGLGVADWRNRSDDHLVVELLFIARLLQNVQADALMEAARFMDAHLLRWLPRFGERVAKRCATPFYAAAAWLTAAYCDELRNSLAEILGEPRPGADEIEARMRSQIVQAVPLKYVPGVSPSW